MVSIQWYRCYNNRISTMTDNRELDLGNLTLFDYSAVKSGDTDTQTAENITAQLVDNLQFILSSFVQQKKKQIAAVEVLPEEQQIHDFTLSKLFLTLPEPTTVFPRSRRIPQPKKQTKWQQFAKTKGIKKSKVSGMSYDPTLKTQVARWGKKSKKSIMDSIPILEQKQAGRNPFLDAQNQKKLRKVKNRLKQAKNKNRAAEDDASRKR